MSPDEKTERRFGDFELLYRIGRDGLFHLFRARQPDLDRFVTLKVLPPRVVTLERTALFRREADAAQQLDHAGALRVYEVGDVAGVPYLALAPVDGILLAERLKANPLPPREAIEVTKKLAEVLQHAHGRGVIHGALRPEAIWLTRDGDVRLAGFGCPIQFEALDVEMVESYAGYLAPEEAGGRGAVGKATDVHGLGALLYAMLTGGPPFQASSLIETCRLIRSQLPAPPSWLHPGVPHALDDICLKCLQLEPARRYGLERPLPRLIAALQHVESRRDDSLALQIVERWLARHGRLAWTAALVLILAATPAFLDWRRQHFAWETLTQPGLSSEEYGRAARHFERRFADEPFDAEIAAGRALALHRMAQSPLVDPTELRWRNSRAEWKTIQDLTLILAALQENRHVEARAALATARAAGFMPQSTRQKRLLDECEQKLAAGRR